MDTMTQAQPYREERRRGVAFLLIGIASHLEITIDGYLETLEMENDYNSLTHKELHYLVRIRRYMKWQCKALRAIAKSMGVDYRQ